jgi:hypothetical protein
MLFDVYILHRKPCDLPLVTWQVFSYHQKGFPRSCEQHIPLVAICVSPHHHAANLGILVALLNEACAAAEKNLVHRLELAIVKYSAILETLFSLELQAQIQKIAKNPNRNTSCLQST